LVIVARGFADDVQNTLGVNFSTGNLSIIPVVVHYDEFGANLVNDIAVVVGCDLVNSLKGDVISAINWDDILHVSSLSVNLKTMTMSISNDRTKNSVKRQRYHIKEKQKSKEGLYNSDVFDKRLACLMGQGVVITLGQDLGDQWGITKDRISSHLKIFRDASRFGLINIDSILDDVSNQGVRKSLMSIRKLSNIVISKALLVGIKIGFDSSQVISRVGGIVYVDNKTN